MDFACHGSKLVIEIDGSQHAFAREQRRDRERDAYLAASGFRVLRFWNSNVDRELEGVMNKIMHELETTPTRRANAT